MSVAVAIRPGLYRDSVALLEVARALRAIDGVEEAAALMATPANRDLLAAAGLLEPEAAAAGPADLVVAVRAASAAAAEQALAAAERALAAPSAPAGVAVRRAPRTIETACRRRPDSSLAVISVPGAFAAGLARRALGQGLSAMLFSDNVALADEIALKRQALARGQLLLGPDCGTAYVDGVGLGFANAVPRGRVGVVAASGTGLQQLAVLLAARGEGVSQGIGVGGRDMSDAVGGLMTLAALDALAADPSTALIAVVGKPPAPAVRRAVEARLAAAGKPAVVALLGPGADAGRAAGARDFGRVRAVSTLEDAADAILAALHGRPWTPVAFSATPDEVRARLDALRRELPAGPVGLRGLYAGGTLAHEANGILVPLLGAIDGNLGPAPHAASLHQVLDLGADEYTIGRAHPMLDGALRASLIERAARNPRVGVLLLDVVLGHGAAADPAGDLAPTLRSARARARADGRGLAVVATVVGTADDPQGLAAQVARLEAEGAWVLPSNAQAARAAACLVGGPGVADAVLTGTDATGGAASAGTAGAFVAPDGARGRATPAGTPPVAPAAGTARRGDSSPGGPLLGRALSVVNVGLESFAADLGRRGVPTVHVAWAPPAGGNARAAALLDLLEDDD